MKEKNNFQKKYDEYLAWKKRRAELFPEFRDPERKRMKNSWHFEGCANTGRVVINEVIVNPRTQIASGIDNYEAQTCFDCGASRLK